MRFGNGEKNKNTGPRARPGTRLLGRRERREKKGKRESSRMRLAKRERREGSDARNWGAGMGE